MDNKNVCSLYVLPTNIMFGFVVSIIFNDGQLFYCFVNITSMGYTLLNISLQEKNLKEII